MKNKKINQCDGCRRGLPLKDGIHRNPDGSYDMIGCTKNRYRKKSPAQEEKGEPKRE